jgi:hypothetical protein
MASEFGCTHGCTLDGGGEAISVVQNCVVLVGNDQVRRKSRKMEDAPESITAAGKMMAGLRRAQRRVDAAEQHVEIFGDQVSQSKDVRSLLHPKSSISQSAGIDVQTPRGIAPARK